MKRINDHNSDRGTWCRWSKCEVADTYSKSRCPDQCKESKILSDTV